MGFPRIKTGRKRTKLGVPTQKGGRKRTKLGFPRKGRGATEENWGSSRQKRPGSKGNWGSPGKKRGRKRTKLGFPKYKRQRKRCLKGQSTQKRPVCAYNLPLVLPLCSGCVYTSLRPRSQPTFTKNNTRAVPERQNRLTFQSGNPSWSKRPLQLCANQESPTNL